ADAAAETSRLAVALGAGRPGPGGRVDARAAQTYGRRRTLWVGAFGLVLAVYASVMFVRIATLAARIWTGPLVVLAAVLVALFTVGAPAVLCWRWSRGNALGDQMREYGGLLAEARATADDLAERVRDDLERCSATVDAARRAQVQGDQALSDGYRRIGV